MKRLIRGGTVVTLDDADRVLDPGIVVFDDNIISYVGPPDGYTPTGDEEVLLAEDQVILPGLVNTHTHSCMALFRSSADDVPLGEWLPRYLYPMERQTTPDDLYWAAVLGCCEMLANGITTTADRFSQMSVQAEGIAATGIRAVLGATLTDARRDQQQADALALLERWGTAPESRIRAALAPHATETCGPELLRWIRRIADERGAQIYIHLAQSREEVAEVAARHGIDGCARYLDRHGMLGPDVIAAHCVYVDDEEVDILARTDTRVAHCPVSNVKIEARMAPIPAMVRAGVVLGLGTDCAASNNGMDLFTEMKCAGLLNKLATGDPTFLPAARLLRLATTEAARVLGIDHLVGSLNVGKRADVIALDRDTLHLAPWNDLYGTLVYAARGADVRHVFVDGRAIVLDRRLLSVDAAELARHVRTIGERLRDLASRRR
jgi:5-methylthioadenosine/S-adenosylhomocysteine deaminase